MSDQAEIDRLRDRQLDPSTGARQRLLIRCMVALSLTLVALGEVLSIVRHEPPRYPRVRYRACDIQQE
jgi:hypothetical protein